MLHKATPVVWPIPGLISCTEVMWRCMHGDCYLMHKMLSCTHVWLHFVHNSHHLQLMRPSNAQWVTLHNIYVCFFSSESHGSLFMYNICMCIHTYGCMCVEILVVLSTCMHCTYILSSGFTSLWTWYFLLSSVLYHSLWMPMGQLDYGGKLTYQWLVLCALSIFICVLVL